MLRIKIHTAKNARIWANRAMLILHAALRGTMLATQPRRRAAKLKICTVVIMCLSLTKRIRPAKTLAALESMSPMWTVRMHVVNECL